MNRTISASEVGKLNDRAIAEGLRRGYQYNPFVRKRRQNPAVGGIEEVITQPVYDSFSVAANTPFPKTTMFQTPIGQGGKTLAQTNMTKAGVLENPQKLDIRAIRLYVKNDAVMADLNNLLVNCSFVFTVGKKPMLEIPCLLLTAGCGATYFGGNIGTVAAGDGQVFGSSNGSVDPRAVFTLSQPIVIEGGEGFNVTINAETAFNTANAGKPVGSGLTIYVILDGELYRQVQ